MSEIVIPGLFFLTGISAYAAVNHFSICSHRPLDRVHLLFAGMCVIMILFSLAHIAAYHAITVAEYVTALRWSLSFILVYLFVFPWFIAEYTGVRPLPLLAVFSILFAVLFLANMLQPYTLQYQTIESLTRLHLPWGEELTLPLGRNGGWFAITLAVILSEFGFSFYALTVLYRRGRKRTALIMMLAVGIFLAASIEGILVRASLIEYIMLGPFAYLAIIIVMSIILSYESRQNGARLQTILDQIPAVVYLKDPAGRYLMINRHFENLFRVSNAAILGKTDFDFFPEAQANVMRANDRQVLSTRRSLEQEEIVGNDGDARTYQSLKFSLLHMDGAPYAVCGISTDITDRKSTEDALRVSELRFGALVEQSPYSIQVMSPNGQTLRVNPAWEKLWGMKAAMLENYNMLQDRQLADKGVMPYIEKGFAGVPTVIPPIIYNPAANPLLPGPTRDRWVSAYIYPVKNDTGAVCEVVVMHEDVTEKKRVEDVIRHIAAGVSDETGKRFFHQIVQSLSKVFDADYAFIAVLDEHNQEQVNTLAVCAHGQIVDNLSYSLRDSPCANVMGLSTCAYPRDVQRLFPKDTLLSKLGVNGYIGAPMFDSRGDPLGFIVVLDSQPLQQIDQVKDILEIFAARAGAEMERNQANAQIRRMAYQDYLTGLASRALLHEQLAEVLGKVRQAGQIGAMLMIDLDHFKTINNALSHDVGDEVLKMIARRLVVIAAERIFVARLGGDDFVMLIKTGFPNAAEVELYTRGLAERTMAALASPLILGDRVLNVGASMGAVLFPGNGENELDILRHADMALYQAKNMGRNNIQFYLPSLQAVAEERLKLEDGLRSAIDNSEMELYFQPQLSADGMMVGAEVLLRWHHPEMGNISPSIFIPVAEDTGLIHGIGRWVFDQACGKLAVWLQAGIPFSGHLAINVCPWQFARQDFVQQIELALAERKIAPERLMLEVTESALLYNIEEAVEKLKTLRSMGLKVSLDDFGTGYSSLSYLRLLPLDELKIDISFVHELGDKPAHPLVEAIIAIGRHMKLDVIAEGVESEMQRDILAKLGCKNFQGYLFSKPLPEKEFLAWLKSGKTPA